MHKLLVLPSAGKDLDSLPDQIFRKIKEKLLSLKDNPRPSGCIKLTGEEGYRLRSGDYRILYRIDDKEKAVYIYGMEFQKTKFQPLKLHKESSESRFRRDEVSCKIKHRREAYR